MRYYRWSLQYGRLPAEIWETIRVSYVWMLIPREEEKLARQVLRSHNRQHAGNRAADNWLPSRRFVCTHVRPLSIGEECTMYAKSTGAYPESEPATWPIEDLGKEIA